MNRTIALSALLLMVACGPTPQPPAAPLSVAATLSAENADYAQALAPRPLVFPQDHGAHPDYRIEWWYFTGNLRDPTGRHFGFQFTLFRNAVTPEPPVSQSRWATNQLYLAHASLTDVAAGEFYNAERAARGALGLAGVTVSPLRAWLEDWQVSATEADCETCFAVRIAVAAEDFSLDLKLRNNKPAVLHGDRGLSAKGTTPGNASYYYSYTRLVTTGTVRQGDREYAVQGESWFDHEWSSSALEQNLVGWDWFSLQLSDLSELMLFQFRDRASGASHFGYGSLIDPQGRVTRLQANEFTVGVTDYWRSPRTGVQYPAAWTITVPRHALDLTVAPRLAAQEMALSFRYWEGAVAATGRRAAQPLTGQGYVELTGYGDTRQNGGRDR